MDFHALTETVPGAITLFFTVLAAIGTGAAGVAKAWRWVTDKKVQSIPATAPVVAQPTNPFGHTPLTDPMLVAHMQVDLMRNALKQAEWQVSDLRDEMALVRRDMAEVAADARKTASALQAAQIQLDAAHAKIATLENELLRWQAESKRLARERDAADARALYSAQELARYKQDSGSALSAGPASIITPIRPPARPKGTP